MKISKNLSRAIVSLISVLFSALLISLVAEKNEFVDISITSISVEETIVCTSLLFVSWAFGGWRLSILFKLANIKDTNASQCFAVNWGGAFFAFGVPLGPIADPARVFMLLRLGAPLQITVKTIILDKSVQLLFTFTLITVCAVFQSFFGVDRYLILLQLALGVCFFCIGLLAFFLLLKLGRKHLAKWGYKLGTLQVIRENVNYKISIKIIALSCVTVLCHWGIFLVLLPSDALQLTNILVLLLVTPMIFLIQHLPFLFSGWGGREMFFDSLQSIDGGASSELLLNTSILFGATYTLVSLTGFFAFIAIIMRSRRH